MCNKRGRPGIRCKDDRRSHSGRVENGLPEDLAVQLATTTVGGSYKLLVEEDITPQDLRVRVCSPGGTTLAALAAMDDVGFTRSITAGIDAAINRAKELAQ